MNITNPNIDWTKEYLVKHHNGTCDFYIAKNRNGYFNGAIVYYETNPKYQKGSVAEPHYIFKLEQFTELTEDEVYNRGDEWLSRKYAGTGHWEIGDEKLTISNK